jgi:hypothetical protein
MLKQLTKFLLAVLLGSVGALSAFAQDKTDFKVGDTIYVNAFSGGCVTATVTQTNPKYSVHILEGLYKDRDTFYNESRIRECPQTAPQDKPKADMQTPAEAANPPAQKPGDLKVGTRVDVYLTGNQQGKNRGTIIEINGSQYKVHYDGCTTEKDDIWENFTLVRPAAVISADNAEIKFLAGKWSMTTVGVSSAAIAWSKSPGIQINSDGTYIWYQDGGKPPVRGKWLPHAKIEGAREGTETVNGIIIKDAMGAQWKMYRRKSTLDNNDHITIRLMCVGKTEMGTRAQ